MDRRRSRGGEMEGSEMGKGITRSADNMCGAVWL